MSQTVLELEKLTIALPPGADRTNAVSDVDLVLRAGKVTCLIGESGSGKSLVARSILGLLPRPHVRIGSGRILFEGQDLAVAPQDQMRAIRGAKIGMIFQEPMTALNPLHTIGRQLDECCASPPRESRRRARVLSWSTAFICRNPRASSVRFPPTERRSAPAR
jgi:peptide/nickel transport system ATP-binding protein